MARAAKGGASIACGASITRTHRWPPPSASARMPRSQLPKGFAMKTIAQSLEKVSTMPLKLSSSFLASLLTTSIFADYADFLRDDSEAIAAPAANTICNGDTSKYCGLVKSFNMCHVRKYKRQCCASCPAASH